MVWYLPWSESIKKRACRYLLQRYLGNFLEEKLTLDQLTVDLYNGTGTVSDVSLDCEALNEVGDSQNWPLEIVDGYMREITVTIPWSTLLKDDSVVEVDGLSLTVQPKVRPEPECGMLESMWSSMSSSLRIAEECLREDAAPASDAAPVEGVEMFAHAIDSILSRVKVRFINTRIRIEHVPKNSDRGIAMEIHIESVEYLDEAGSEPEPDETSEAPHTYLVATHTHKRVRLRGVTLHSDEFPSTLRTMARSLISERSQTPTEDVNYQSTTSDVFYETKSMISSDIDPVEKVIEETIPHKVKESTPEHSPTRPDPVLFARLSGVHELGLKMKCGEEVEGPKVQVEVTLGALSVLLTPRQMKTMLELLEALSQPQLEDTSNIPARGHNLAAQCKPMQRADFQLIEAQLLGELGARGTTHRTGWSGPNLEDSTADSERFHPLTSHGMTDSIASASSLSASMTSSVSVPCVVPRRNRRGTHIDGDPTAEVSHVSLRIVSLSVVLFHKDILIPSPLGSEYIPPSSAAKMQQIACDYFTKLDELSSVEERRRDLEAIMSAIEKATERNHIRLVACEIGVAGNEKVTSGGSQTTCEVTIQTLAVQEALYYTLDDVTTPQHHAVLTTRHKEEADGPAPAAVRVKYKQVSKYIRVAGEKKLGSPNTELGVECGELDIDVDLTLADRMAATLYGGSPATSNVSAMTQQQASYSLRCPRVDVILRFPIADLRPGVSREWRRVRDDFLVLRLTRAHVSCSKPASMVPLPTTVTFSAHDLDLYYHDSGGTAGTHIAHAAADATQTGTIVTLPQISITVKPRAPTKGPFDPLSDDDAGFEPPPGSNPMTTSMYILSAVHNAEPSPFSGKKTAHQSRAKHEGSPHGIEEDMIVPGSVEEMAAFTESVSSRSEILVELAMPALSLQLESKQLYEILYNRINSDLLVWEPMSMDQFDINPMAAIHPAFSICKGSGYDSDSGSSSSEEENLYYSTYDARPKTKTFTPTAVEKRESHYFCLTLKVDKGLLTIYAPVRDSNKRVVPGQMGELMLEASGLSLCTASGVNQRGKCAQMCLRGSSVTAYHNGIVTIPAEKPDLRLLGSSLPVHLRTTIYPIGRGAVIKDNLQKKDMFTMALKVEPDNDTPNLKSICISLGVEQATLRHRDITWLSQLLDVLDVVDYPVLGCTPSTVLSELHVHVTDCAVDYRPLYLPIRALVTLGTFSVSSNIIPATNTSCLRFLAQECTLFLSSVPSKQDVPISLDDDKLPDVHKDYVCVLDLALFELSLRMENKDTAIGGGAGQPVVDVSASNNLVTLHTCWDSATALCRLVTYIACDGDNAPPDDVTLPSHSHDDETLVGVDDKQLEEIRELSPSEIQQVNDLMAEALKESPNTTLDEDELVSSTEKEGVEIFFFPDESSSKQRQLSDAIDNDETRSIDNELSLSIDKEDRLSFDKESMLSKDSEERLSIDKEDRTFIDKEDIKSIEQAQEATPTNVHVVKELGDPTSTPKGSPRKTRRKKVKSGGDGSNTDDEFCIVESHYNEDNELEEPVVNWLGSNPTHMLDNHFTVPCARSDVLKAPKSFPLPVLRYTLCEMSVTWNMFGGTDFKPAADAAKTKKSVTIDDDVTRLGSPVQSRSPSEYSPYDTERSVAAAYRTSGVRWSSGADRVTHGRAQPRRDQLKTRGGLHRDHDTCVKLCLNKVKFVHETYDVSCAGGVASRQVLAIAGVEVLDRVQRSHINKLLSHYQRSDEPPRTNAHMLVVKAVHFRGEERVSGAECCLKVSLLPLRFNLDQDTLAFLSQYFSKLGCTDTDEEGRSSTGSVTSDSAAGGRQRPPVMSVGAALRDPPPTPTSLGDADALSLNDCEMGSAEPLLETFEAERLVSENLIQLEEDFNKLDMRTPAQPPPQSAPSSERGDDDEPIYFRRVVFSPEVPIRVDYVGKRVELSAGPVAGLLLGLTQLNCSELTLKRLDYRLGLLGFGRLVQWALREWLADVKRHQLPALLGGIPPLHSLLQLITGIRDLVWLPVEQWRRDGRLVLGLRRGAASFTARTAVAALDITTRLLHLIQATAETALEMVTPAAAARSHAALARSARSRRRRDAPPPADIRQGVATAYQTLREGIAEQAARLSVAHSGGGSGVLRQLPGAAVAPLALAAAGAADLLGGVRASLAPETARDHRDKWRH